MQVIALVLFFAIPLAIAQRPPNISICDWYAETLFGSSTATNQQLVMTHITNTAIIGNYAKPDVGINVTGIAPVSTFNGTSVNLLSYFDAALYSSNDGVTPHGVAKNFLDDGGAVPLSMSLPSNGNISSSQYKLLTHVYQYFGVLLGCSLQGSEGFPAYEGRQSMYEVHKYMYIDPFEQGWFVNQLTLAAASIGFSSKDTTIWFNIMTGLFSSRCSPATAVGNEAPQLQSICVAPDCPLAQNPDCSAYDVLSPPLVANATLAGNYTKLDNDTSSTSSPVAFTGNANSNIKSMLMFAESLTLTIVFGMAMFGN
ncbi:hypothetical protein B7494_g5420 [Chlorociboria aeruginascens]|nr:hypothetical protein B7494_g5420 [Chlorociboria aeruginascens]